MSLLVLLSIRRGLALRKAEQERGQLEERLEFAERLLVGGPAISTTDSG